MCKARSSRSIRALRLKLCERKEWICTWEGGAFFRRSQRLHGRPTLEAKYFLITTGVTPPVPDIAGLRDVPFVTYHQIFGIREMPRSSIVVGGGPVGTEIAQAYRRFGPEVTVIADTLLPKEDEDAREIIERVFTTEGVQRVKGRAKSARKESDTIIG